MDHVFKATNKLFKNCRTRTKGRDSSGASANNAISMLSDTLCFLWTSLRCTEAKLRVRCRFHIVGCRDWNSLKNRPTMAS
eukprot:9962400-Karenia_brevis.AAC.1